MKVLSLFDGISCARVALDRAGIPVESYYASEIDKYAIQISQKNYPDIRHIGDIQGVYRPRAYNVEVDLIIGGSPCQDLSIAGKRKGLSGERSGLFYEYARILNEVRPKYFILENVASMSKEAKETITKELFGVEPVMINASLVSAQNRKRLFWVGKLVGDTYQKVEISQPEDRGILLKDILEENVDEKYYLNESAVKTINRNFGSKGKTLNINAENSLIEKITYPSRINQIEDAKKCPTLTSSMGTGGGNVPVIIKGYCELDGKAKPMTATMYKGFGNDGVTVVNSFNTRIFEEKSGTIGTHNGATNKQGHQVVDGKFSGIRKLTPVECERLQGLPDNHTEGVSNTQRYKTLGNAFNVDVVAHIIKELK